LLKQLRPETPDTVVSIVSRLTAGRPEDRYQTPVELLAAFGVQLAPPVAPMEPAKYAPAVAAPPPAPPPPPPPLKPQSKPGVKMMPEDWDEVTSEPIAAAPRPATGVSIKKMVVVLGGLALGGILAIGVLVVVLRGRGSNPPPEDDTPVK